MASERPPPAKPGGPSRKVRLPVVQPDDDVEERPPWQWAVIGALTTLFAWLPAAAVVALVTRPLLPPAGEVSVGLVAVGLSHLGAFALACFASGVLVGRFGKDAGEREAGIGGALAASFGFSMVLGRGLRPLTAVAAALPTLAVGFALARAGARWGLRLRRRAPPP
jgi:hypothetical protein